jgi:hypothetical protein
MMDLATVPLIIDQSDINDALAGDMSGVQIPYVGSRTPRGWRRLDAYETLWSDYDGGPYGPHGYLESENAVFVDKSGFGSPGEPALTLDEFLALIRPGYGYAVIEAGPFQVKVGVFERADCKRRETRPAGVLGRCFDK